MSILYRPNGFQEPLTLEEYTRAFAVFDKSNNSHIGLGQLRYVLTSLGEKLTNEEFDDIIRDIKEVGLTPNANDEIDYRKFVEIVTSS